MFLVRILCVVSLTQLVSTYFEASDCGNETGCFPDCGDRCKYLVTWQKMTGEVKFTLKAEKTDQSQNSIAIGFSKDRRMGDDSVVLCDYRWKYWFGSNDVRLFHNSGLKSDELSVRQNSEYGIFSGPINDIDGIISCSFTRRYATVSDQRIFDVRHNYIIMLVLMESDTNYYEYDHIGKHYMIPWMSSRKVNFLSHSNVDEYIINSPLVKLHGIMMVFAWLFLSTIGIFTARYYKSINTDDRSQRQNYWFPIHRFVMICVMVCVSVGFIAIFVENKGYSQVTATKEKVLVQWHPIIGLIVTVLCFVNPLMAMIRPSSEHRLRSIFNWAHFGVGALTQTLAVAAILLGYFLERTQSKSSVYVTVGHLIVTMIFYAFMEVYTKLYGYGNLSRISNMEERKHVSSEDQSTLTTLPILVFSLISLGFSLVTAVSLSSD